MDHWVPSRYTTVISCDSGETLLYNSFMGAVARVPAPKSPAIHQAVREGVGPRELTDPALRELCDGGFLVPSHLDEWKLVSEVLEKERNALFSIVILPHENCNFRCVYCYESFARGKMKPEVVAGLKDLVERKAKEYPRLSTCWFGGEPLLAKDVIYDLSRSFVAACKRNDVAYTSSMTTNGYYLTPEVVETLLSYGVRHFQVTLDGPEVVHDKARKLVDGRGTYKTVLGNLERMRRRTDDFRVRIRVNFFNTPTSVFEEWLHTEIAPMFADDRRFAVRFHSVGQWGGARDSTLDVCDATMSSRVKLGLRKESLALGLSDEVVKEFLKPHGSVCYAAKESSMVVGADGAVYKCTVAFDDARNHVGRLTEEEGLVIDQARWDAWVSLDGKDTRHCICCTFYPTCQGRKCPLAALNSGKPACPMTQMEYESLVRLLASSSS